MNDSIMDRKIKINSSCTAKTIRLSNLIFFHLGNRIDTCARCTETPGVSFCNNIHYIGTPNHKHDNVVYLNKYANVF